MVKEGKIQTVKYAPPPPELPVLGKFDARDVSYIGRTNYAAGLEEKRHVFGLKRSDRIRHMYIIGKSGMGKSKLLELLIRQDIAYGRGVCLIDPRGAIVRAMLDFIPEERIDDVCVINPADAAFPLKFNPFAGIDPVFRHQFTQGFVEIMKREIGSGWTAHTEHVLRFAVLALLGLPDATLAGVLKLLTEKKFRAAVSAHIEDEMVRRFWADEFETWAEKYDAEAVIPLVNRLSSFLSNPLLRAVFSGTENTIDFAALMNGEKLIFIDLAKDKLGDENAAMLGLLFMVKMRQAAATRVEMPSWSKKDFYCYIDEFQNLITDTFEQLLADAAKYGLCMTLSHQYIGQLGARVQSAVLGSVGNVIIFRVGGEDAGRLESEMMPVFKAKDMINLGQQELYIKMTIDGEAHDPFSAETLRVLPPSHPSYAERVIEASRKVYARLV